MQEHVTKVELYGKLAELLSNTTRHEDLTVFIKRNNVITKEHPLSTRIYMIIEKEGAILAKFEVLDIDGEYSDGEYSDAH